MNCNFLKHEIKIIPRTFLSVISRTWLAREYLIERACFYVPYLETGPPFLYCRWSSKLCDCLLVDCWSVKVVRSSSIILRPWVLVQSRNWLLERPLSRSNRCSDWPWFIVLLSINKYRKILFYHESFTELNEKWL